ncbi:TonB-dependent receptor [Massilia orientalis]|uniref:TonB-dependent receptor n=1 Tax=Massilia orientalis TaxID=3050128 RepID=A0ACC7M5I5_9BURK|nr:TonB-dependent receptor [Massilia sp. YIM B02787]
MKQNHRNLGPTMSVVAVALAQAFASHAWAQQADANTVVVTGIRASAQSSLAIKRDSMEVVDSISADDIGKLPDPNVTETMTRIPGVQGYRYGGEGASPVGQGSGVTIRGLSGQTASEVNGRAYFTAGSREFNLEGAIPGMVAGIDVYKNPSAEHIEGAIGGLVNIRTRNPSDFKGLTGALNIGGRYNDLAKKGNPELFGMIANRWNLQGGGRIGVMAAAVFQQSTGRSDNNPANGGANYKRAVRADSAEYATLAAANAANDPSRPMSHYVGRTDVSYLASVPTLPTSTTAGAYMPNLAGLTQEQIGNVMAAPAITNNVFQETIMRTRRGLNLAADWRVDNTLRFYVDGNYTYYLYHQNYRGLNSSDINTQANNVQNLQTAPFSLTEQFANGNLNGGSNDVLATKRFLSGNFLNTRMTTTGGDEHRPYTTWIAATGAEWHPTPALFLKADINFIKADQTQDNRAVTLLSNPGLYWTVNRVADGAPHQTTFTGPDLSNPANFMYQAYSNGTHQSFHDTGGAVALDGTYSLDDGWFFSRIKFGTRAARQSSSFNNFAFSGRPLTTDGLPLAADGSNGISAATGGHVQSSPTNFMDGLAGYSGGYAVYNPDQLLGNQVSGAFPKAGILPENGLAEQVLARRYTNEKTKAIYLVGEFSLLDDRLKGNAGVRVVRTNGEFVAQVPNASGVIGPYSRTTSYTNALPSFNLTYDLAKDFLARFGYGRGMTRPGLDQLNPYVTYNSTQGTASVGNPELHPLTANSFDFSLERYFSKTNYLAAGVFDKEINGFFNDVQNCESLALAPAYNGAVANGCSGGQYLVSKTLNSEKGYARGVELSGQYFFDSAPGILKNFGVAGSYTYVKTDNPFNVGTKAAPNIISTPQPFASKNSYSVSALYEDNKASARLVYTWRSPSVLFGFSPNPIDGRYIDAYGILDGSFNYQLTDNLALSLIASNITNKTLNRNVGGLGNESGIERQHYENGRFFGFSLRYKFGNL